MRWRDMLVGKQMADVLTLIRAFLGIALACLGLTQGAEGLPWGGVFRRERLDYIFFKPDESPWQVVDARHLDPPGETASDHRVVMARLEFPLDIAGELA